MDERQAKGIVALLCATFPRDQMPDSTVKVWAAGLTQAVFEDAQVAVEDCAALYDRMPSLRQVLVACDRARADRLMVTPQLPESTAPSVSFAEWLSGQPADTQERARKAFSFLREKFDVDLEAS